MAADRWDQMALPRTQTELETVPAAERESWLLLHHTAAARGGIRENSRHQQNQAALALDDPGSSCFTGNHWIRWVLRQLSGRRRAEKVSRVLSLAFFVVLQAAGQAAGALAAGSIARELTNVKSYLEAQASVAAELLPYCVLGLAAAGVKGTGLVGAAYYQSEITGRIASRLRLEVARRLIGAGTAFSETGLCAALSVRLREFHDAVAHGLFGMVRALAQLIPISVALIFVSPLLAVFGAVLLVPFGVGLGLMRNRWRRASNRAQKRQEELHAGVDELVRNLDLWRTCDANGRIHHWIETAGEQAARTSARVRAAQSAISSGNEFLGTLLVAGTLLLVASNAMPVDAASAVAFVTIVLMSYRPLRDLGDARGWLAHGDAASLAIEAAIEALPAGGHSQSTTGPRHGEWGRAPERLDVFAPSLAVNGQPLHVALQPGTLLCVRGPTGCGKTTLLRELLGLERGAATARYGGRDLDSSVPPSARPFAWVPQDAPLVTGTILENITLVGVSDREARACLNDVGAGDLADSVGTGIVGPGGHRLSGGEKRLVSIARALAQGAPVLLLDEPTEGLDPAATAKVLQALARLKGSRSLLVVTHRQEIGSVADHVIQCDRALERI